MITALTLVSRQVTYSMRNAKCIRLGIHINQTSLRVKAFLHYLLFLWIVEVE